jgi:hypothetical protein
LSAAELWLHCCYSCSVATLPAPVKTIKLDAIARAKQTAENKNAKYCSEVVMAIKAVKRVRETDTEAALHDLALATEKI